MGKPVIVGGRPESRGVVAAANYVARRFGVHSAMPAVTAQRLCPTAIFLSSRIDHYAQVSEQIRAIFHEYPPLVEPLSLDEAFLDVAGSERLFGSAVEIGRGIKQAIQQRLQLVASVGVAPNKFLAKVASDLRKPDGFVVVEPGQEQPFLDPLPVGRLWGVGKVTGAVFARLGVQRISQLRQMPVEVLRQHFGQAGDHLWNLAHGIDSRRVVAGHVAKSISHETTFATDITDLGVVRAWILELSEQVGWRLRRHGLTARTVHLKVRYPDFHTITRAQKLAQATDATQVIWQTADRLVTTRLPRRRLEFRLLGLGVSGLEGGKPVQRTLFPEADPQRQSRLDQVADQIKDKFGGASLRRGLGMLYEVNPRSPSDRSNRDQYDA